MGPFLYDSNLSAAHRSYESMLLYVVSICRSTLSNDLGFVTLRGVSEVSTTSKESAERAVGWYMEVSLFSVMSHLSSIDIER